MYITRPRAPNGVSIERRGSNLGGCIVLPNLAPACAGKGYMFYIFTLFDCWNNAKVNWQNVLFSLPFQPKMLQTPRQC
jgi:hypothetical protein